MNKLTILTAVIALLITVTSAHAGVMIADPGFDNDLTDVGSTLTQADSANFDKWVFYNDPNNQGTRKWKRPATGGNPGGYADGTFGNSTSYTRVLYQIVTDDKATTGLLDLTFDLNLKDNNAPANPVEVSVWGIVNSSSSFDLSLTGAQTMNADDGLALLLATASYTDTTGWQQQTVSNINFGTGYDLIIIGFKSNNHKEDDIVGIDNVAIGTVPEPASLALIGIGSLLVFGRKRRGA